MFTNFNTSILSTPHGHPNILLVLHASLFLYFCDIIFCYNTRKYRQFMHEPLPILLIINTIIWNAKESQICEIFGNRGWDESMEFNIFVELLNRSEREKNLVSSHTYSSAFLCCCRLLQLQVTVERSIIHINICFSCARMTEVKDQSCQLKKGRVSCSKRIL